MIKKIFQKLSYQEKKYLVAILIYIIAFAGYLKTMSPTVSFEDSGEFITISYVLGDAHPPGYPLYTLFGKIFTFIPISNIAFRVVSLSAYFGAGIVLLLYFIILLLFENSKARPSILAAATAALVFAFSSVQWDLSIIDEVYSMSTFFVALQVFMLLKWQKSLDEPYTNIYEKYSLRRMGYLYAFSMIYGLSFGVHQVAVLFVVAFLYFIFANDYKILLDPTSAENALITLKNSAILLFMWCIGFLVFFYLPVRSVNNPTIDWGDPETWFGFQDVFLRRQYGGTPGFGSSFPEFLKKIPFFDLSHQFTPIFVIPVLFGIWKQYKLNIKHFVFISCLFVSYSVGFLLIIDPPIPYELPLLLQTFYIPLHFTLAIWMGMGFSYVADIIELILNTPAPAKKIAAFVLTAFVCLLPILPYSYGYPGHNHVKHYFAYDYGMNMLRSTERNGVLFTFLAQDTFPLWYLTHVEGRRKDVIVVHQRLLSLPWHSKQVKNNHPEVNIEYPRLSGYNAYNLFLIADIATQTIMLKNPERPIYFSNFRTPAETKSYPLKETGIIGKVSSAPNPPRIVGRDIFRYYVYRELFREGEVFKDNRVREISSVYVSGHLFEAGVYIDYRKLILQGISLLKQALAITPDEPYIYRNLAQAYEILGMKEVSIQLLERSLLFDNNSKDAEYAKRVIKMLKGGGNL